MQWLSKLEKVDGHHSLGVNSEKKKSVQTRRLENSSWSLVLKPLRIWKKRRLWQLQAQKASCSVWSSLLSEILVPTTLPQLSTLQPCFCSKLSPLSSVCFSKLKNCGFLWWRQTAKLMRLVWDVCVFFVDSDPLQNETVVSRDMQPFCHCKFCSVYFSGDRSGDWSVFLPFILSLSLSFFLLKRKLIQLI